MDGGNGWLDFTNKGVDKGSALRLLAAKEQFFLDEVLAFGDSENDMAMPEGSMPICGGFSNR